MSAPQFTIGAVYRLDGELLRLKKYDGPFAPATFQRIKQDGRDDIGKYPDHYSGTKGIRLIRYRLSEMEQVNEQWECNECGAQSYTQSVTIEDLQCPECGCDEFHLTPEKQ